MNPIVLPPNGLVLIGFRFRFKNIQRSQTGKFPFYVMARATPDGRWPFAAHSVPGRGTSARQRTPPLSEPVGNCVTNASPIEISTFLRSRQPRHSLRLNPSFRGSDVTCRGVPNRVVVRGTSHSLPRKNFPFLWESTT